jgi:hypothetical protein
MPEPTRPLTVYHEGRHYQATGRVQDFAGVLVEALGDLRIEKQSDGYYVGKERRWSGPYASIDQAREAGKSIWGGRTDSPGQIPSRPLPPLSGQPNKMYAEYSCFEGGRDLRVWADARGMVKIAGAGG